MLRVVIAPAFNVLMCISTGAAIILALSIASQSWFMLWPSMGPIYLKPRSSKKELEYRIFLSAVFSLKR